MDTFIEHLVKKKVRPLQWVIYVLIVVLALLIGFMAMAIPYVGPLLTVGLLYGCFFLFKRNFVEYEYIYTNGETDLDRIIGKSKRKRLLTFNLNELELLAEMGDEEHRRDFENQNFQKKFDYSAGDEKQKRYFAIVNKKDLGRVLVVYQPSERMLAAMKQVAPRKIFLSK